MMNTAGVIALVMLQILLVPQSLLAAAPEPSGAALLINGDFEQGQGAIPRGWTHGRNRNAAFGWESAGGVDNSRCLSIAISGQGADAAWIQKLKLEPRAAYLLRGMVKGESIVVVQKGGKIGANLCQMGVWGCSSDPRQSTGTFDWKPFEVDFCTGESGEIEIGCRLGHWYSTATGRVWFDNLSLVKNAAIKRYDGQHVYFFLADEDVKSIQPAHLRRWITHLDAGYEAMADLVGYKPFQGSRIGYYTSTWDPGGYAVAGNPIYWMRQFVKDLLVTADSQDNWGFGILHEMGHDFDEEGAWNFNAEFWANFKLHYAVEMLGGKVEQGGRFYTGLELKQFWKGCYERDWRNADESKRSAHHDGLQHVTLLMKEKIGWEPFKRTFRYFHSLPKDQRPRAPWRQFELFYNKLKEFSGVDVWTYFSAEDIVRLKRQYPDQRN